MHQSIRIYLAVLILSVFLHSCGVSPQTARIPAGPYRTNTLKTETLQAEAPLLKQPDTSAKEVFEAAFTELEKMLQGTLAPDFERAVFLSEQPFHSNGYTYESFRQEISFHAAWIALLTAANDGSDTMDFDVPVNRHGRFQLADLRFPPAERKALYRKALANWAIFTYITDTTAIYPLYHPPFSYVSHDPFGIKDWRNSQVLGLLSSAEQQGNCFALTAFYKILADRLDTDAHLCTAPQHIYIRHRDPKGDYYNVELATAGHPGDGTIQTLTHTTPDALQNGIALRSYDAKQSIGLCLIQLAKSYEHRYRTKADDFLLRCADLALRHDSLNLNALLLRQQVLDTRVSSYASAHQISDIRQLKADAEISGTVYELEAQLSRLYRLGYRQMPGYMQEIILTGRYPEDFEDKNPAPFTTIDPKDEHRRQYQGLYRGLFPEVFEERTSEPYGHFILNTASHTLSHIDTTPPTGYQIDPVAFAYDFGARMYDARIGRFTSVDPLAGKYAHWSPYSGIANNPILYVDQDGMEPIDPRTGKPMKLNLNRAAVYDIRYISQTNNKIIKDKDLYDKASPWHNRARQAPDGMWSGAKYLRHETNWEHTSNEAINVLSEKYPSIFTPWTDYGSPNDYMWQKAAELGTYLFLDDTYSESEFWFVNQTEFNVIGVEENYITSIVNLTRKNGDGTFNINSITKFDIEKGDIETRNVKTWWGGTRTEKYRTLTVTETIQVYENNKPTGKTTTRKYNTEEIIN